VDSAVRIQPKVIDLEAEGRPLRVATLHLGGIPRGAVVLLRSGAATGPDVVETMNGLAERGYESVAADLATDLAPSGAPGDDDALRVLEALIELLGRRGWADEQIGLVGYGFGGRIALLAAATTSFGAAVSIDPDGLTDLVARFASGGRGLCTPWLGMFGREEPATPAPGVSRLGNALASSSSVFTQLVSYPGVAGQFYRDDRETVAHAAAFDSWQRVVEWLDARVVPRPTPLAEAWLLRQLVGR